MANTVPVSFSRNDGKKDSAKDPSDLMIEHQRSLESPESDDNSATQEGSDAGTKGTGSAG